MPSIKGSINKFSAYTVPYVLLKNEARTIVVGGWIQRNPNTLVTYWDLIGYEVRSNPTEIIGPKGLLGKSQSNVGFICDEAGVTVALERTGPKLSEMEEIQPVVFGKIEAIEYKLKAGTIPFILVSNNGLTLTWGGHIRKKGQILTDGPGKPVYRILPDIPMVEIINVATGQTGMGYICDEIGITVDLKRDFRVTYPGEHPLAGKNADILAGKEVGILVRFSGAIGRLASFDKIPEIFDVGQSKKNFWMGLIAGLFVMFMIRLLV
jgi:hypothetical protein